MTKSFIYDIKGDSKIKKSNRITNKKLNKLLKEVNIKLKETLKESLDFTGNIQLNFYEGKLASINKSEKIK